jgi:ABC-type Mn2+/Zn2+ transport system permease subunit
MLRTLFLEPFDSAFMRRALVGVLVLGGFVPAVGVWIVLKRLSYLGDAMSHGLLTGVAGAYLLGINLTVGALFGGLLMAAVVGILSTIRTVRSDAAIGIAETVLFSLGLMLVSRNSGRISLDLSHVLFGQIATTSWADVRLNAALAGIGLLFMAVAIEDLSATVFDPVHAKLSGVRVAAMDYGLLVLLAIAVVISLQSVGLLMSVAMLVIPASTARLVVSTLRAMIAMAVLCGLAGGVVGLLVSYHASTPPGATIALTLSALFIVTAVLSQGRNGERSTVLMRRRASSGGGDVYAGSGPVAVLVAQGNRHISVGPVESTGEEGLRDRFDGTTL